jgi:hypothetical protein
VTRLHIGVLVRGSMKFLHLHLFHQVEFLNIEGYDDIKDIVRRVLDAEDNYNLPCFPNYLR